MVEAKTIIFYTTDLKNKSLPPSFTNFRATQETLENAEVVIFVDKDKIPTILRSNYFRIDTQGEG